ncbi:hypothetical protein FRX31_026283 [Thalictrum thalictroides]|uniref:Uncharacterized protein n=1 Tax=Thalictrum thalictroides TaxID=46969 RepID=A0A7J6VIX1_THATH|nr:hypothetical protein FRX31_026283 [Thalictrum thalictroides]
MAISAVAYFFTLGFYGLLLGTTPLLFLSACFGHLNPKEFYANTGVLMLAIIGDVSFILFTNILLFVSYDKLSQYLTRNNVLRFKVLATICMDSVLSFILQGEGGDLDKVKMATICISLYAICSIKLVCGSVDRTRICHLFFAVFIFITIQHALNKNLNRFLSCGIVALAAGIVEVTPSLLEPWNAAVVLTPEMAARAHEVTFGNIRRAIPLLGY